ncbi:hypothetical protein, partial [Rhodothermus marinus]|uniref:hypothetical protein n=1 Tax=Rhodothermus marinus TaxID=29549 RepID=UPI001FB39519
MRWPFTVIVWRVTTVVSIGGRRSCASAATATSHPIRIKMAMRCMVSGLCSCDADNIQRLNFSCNALVGEIPVTFACIFF